MSDAAGWLRDELEADRAEIAAMSPADYGQAAVDTLLTPGLYARSTIHACVYAINHGEKGAEATFSLFKRPLRADCWRTRDDVQASILSALLLGLFATDVASLPADPALAAFVGLQCLPLVADPFAALAGVGR